MGLGGRQDYFSLAGYVSFLPHNKSFAYPVDSNGDKLSVDTNGGFVNEKSGQHHVTADYRYVMRMQVVDSTGSLYVNGSEQAWLLFFC